MGKPEKEEKKESEPIEILSDIDDYQKRIESEWESTKTSYQEKIDQILENFLEETKANPPKQEDNETLFSGADEAIRAIEKKAKNLTEKKYDRARIVNIDWNTVYTVRNRRGLIFGVALLALVGFLCSFYFTVPQKTALPYTHTAGVVIEKNKIYISDWFRRTLYTHEARRGLPIVEVESLPNDFLTGFAVSPNKIWSANGVSAQILEHSRTAEHPVSNRLDSPGKNPTGLYFDGSDLWSLDDQSKKIYRHLGNDIEEIKDEFALPNLSYSGFSMGDSRAWVLNKKSRELYVFRLGDPVKQTGTYDLDKFLKGSTPTGIFITGAALWMTTENPPQLLKLSKRKVLKSQLQ